MFRHWSRVTHKCVGKLTINGSDYGLSPGRHQAIIWTNAGILLIGPLGPNFSEILIEIQTFSLKKIRLKMSSAKCCSFHLGLNVLIVNIYNVLCKCLSFISIGYRRNDFFEIYLDDDFNCVYTSFSVVFTCTNLKINIFCFNIFIQYRPGLENSLDLNQLKGISHLVRKSDVCLLANGCMWHYFAHRGKNAMAKNNTRSVIDIRTSFHTWLVCVYLQYFTTIIFSTRLAITR